jgi:hypothetical protein
MKRDEVLVRVSIIDETRHTIYFNVFPILDGNLADRITETGSRDFTSHWED